MKCSKVYGYVIFSDFRCLCCAEGFGVEGLDVPVTAEPHLGMQCLGCDQYYLGNGEFGTKRELETVGQ